MEKNSIIPEKPTERTVCALATRKNPDYFAMEKMVMDNMEEMRRQQWEAFEFKKHVKSIPNSGCTTSGENPPSNPNKSVIHPQSPHSFDGRPPDTGCPDSTHSNDVNTSVGCSNPPTGADAVSGSCAQEVGMLRSLASGCPAILLARSWHYLPPLLGK
ncbi:hypothetical protein PIB30_094591 [Stylosanthes scabra]|uniref:Uncharacterized protein n=1 Tax=Stylosanthes scabra TaxID=79078 RepID=A0ABU6UXU8_9FABA|nr:hypothetical protein [Stylosanthes scabra]